MKKLLFLIPILLIVNVNNLSAQSTTFKILLGFDDIWVTSYYKDLMNMFPDNKYLEIKQELDDKGNKLLRLELPTKRDGKVGFIATISRFIRVDGGEEICTQQIFFCDNSATVEYITYIKDNYKPIGAGMWSSSFNETFDCVAKLKRISDTSSTIELILKPKEKK